MGIIIVGVVQFYTSLHIARSTDGDPDKLSVNVFLLKRTLFFQFEGPIYSRTIEP